MLFFHAIPDTTYLGHPHWLALQAEGGPELNLNVVCRTEVGHNSLGMWLFDFVFQYFVLSAALRSTRAASRFTTRESGEQCATTSGRSMTQTSSVVSYLAQLLLHSDRAPISVEVLEKFGLTTSVVGDPKLVLINVLILDGASTIVVIAKMPESLVSVSHCTYGVSE